MPTSDSSKPVPPPPPEGMIYDSPTTKEPSSTPPRKASPPPPPVQQPKPVFTPPPGPPVTEPPAFALDPPSVNKRGLFRLVVCLLLLLLGIGGAVLWLFRDPLNNHLPSIISMESEQAHDFLTTVDEEALDEQELLTTGPIKLVDQPKQKVNDGSEDIVFGVRLTESGRKPKETPTSKIASRNREPMEDEIDLSVNPVGTFEDLQRTYLGRPVATNLYECIATSAVFLPDGKRVVTTSSTIDPTQIWDIKTGKELQSHKFFSNGLSQASFSPDGKLIVLGGEYASAFIIDLATGETLHTLTLPNFDPETVAGVVSTSALFSPNGKEVLLISDGNYTPSVWDVESGKMTRMLKIECDLHKTSFSPDGKMIASPVKLGPLALWETNTGKWLRSFDTNHHTTETISFSPDGMKIATSGEKVVRIWDIATGNELRSIDFTSRVNSAFFSPNGKAIVTTHRDKTARIWSVDSGKELAKFNELEGLRSASFSPDGKKILTASSPLRLLTVGEEVLNFQENLHANQVAQRQSQAANERNGIPTSTDEDPLITIVKNAVAMEGYDSSEGVLDSIRDPQENRIVLAKNYTIGDVVSKRQVDPDEDTSRWAPESIKLTQLPPRWEVQDHPSFGKVVSVITWMYYTSSEPCKVEFFFGVERNNKIRIYDADVFVDFEERPSDTPRTSAGVTTFNLMYYEFEDFNNKKDDMDLIAFVKETEFLGVCLPQRDKTKESEAMKTLTLDKAFDSVPLFSQLKWHIDDLENDIQAVVLSFTITNRDGKRNNVQAYFIPDMAPNAVSRIQGARLIFDGVVFNREKSMKFFNTMYAELKKSGTQ